jgi:hypothetical protein
MKDALGHGSSGLGGAASNRTDYARNKIGLAPSAQFSRSGARPAAPLTTSDHVTDLRNRLANAQGPGHMASLLQGIKNATGYST